MNLQGYVICNKIIDDLCSGDDCYHKRIHKLKMTCEGAQCCDFPDSKCVPVKEEQVIALRLLHGKEVLENYCVDGK